MQERFLFRGRRLDNGEWVDGYLWRNKGTYIVPLATGNFMQIDHATVGQCTGLPASKSYRGDRLEDKLIFEGDILKTDKGSKCRVEFGNRYRNYAFVVIYSNGAWDDLDNIDSHTKVEIIGNIHDNPQLLEV